ncbi:hypothetical protein ES703_85845 [subsurface metagenome]
MNTEEARQTLEFLSKRKDIALSDQEYQAIEAALVALLSPEPPQYGMCVRLLAMQYVFSN